MTFHWWYILLILLAIVLIHDLFFSQKHSILRNFPIVGHLRYLLEKVGPELRQYIVANNREELPFNRSERSWVYASSKRENNYQGFGSDQDQTVTNYLFIQPELFPFKLTADHPNHQDPYFSALREGDGSRKKQETSFPTIQHLERLGHELRIFECCRNHGSEQRVGQGGLLSQHG